MVSRSAAAVSDELGQGPPTSGRLSVTSRQLPGTSVPNRGAWEEVVKRRLPSLLRAYTAFALWHVRCKTLFILAALRLCLLQADQLRRSDYPEGRFTVEQGANG